MMYALKFTIAVMLSLAVIGCSRQANPVDNGISHNPASQLVKPLQTGMSTSTDIPVLVAMPRPKTKVEGTSITALVRADSGGVLVLKTSYTAATGPVNVKLRLSIPRNSLSDDTYITMCMDTVSLGLNLTFGPHGTTFLKPAKLDVNASGLDLSGFVNGSSKNDCFYVLNGEWAGDQQADKIQVNVNQGTLYASNVLLNHFSQYAFGRINY